MPKVVSGGRGRGAWGRGAATAAPPPPQAPRGADDGISGSDDDDDDGGGLAGGPALDALQDRLFEAYMEACDALSSSDDGGERDGALAAGLGRVAAGLAGANSMCLICLSSIKPADAVWPCRGCYTVLHLQCLQGWARNQLSAAALRAANAGAAAGSAAAAAAAAQEWSCPACRLAYAAADLPRDYRCFCGKAVEPPWDPWNAPHSCGELCGRALAGGCGHECRLLCHPGPCPPCPLVKDASCFCGKRTSKRRCGAADFSCGAVCARGLPGCSHRCPEVCHAGPCAPCAVQVEQRCRCGAEARVAPCSERDFRCARVHGRLLGCGRHKCERVCCAGDCGGCPVAGRRTCPCGRVDFPDLRCDERAPTCASTCGKPLPCGHACADKCHAGDCSATCRILVVKACRCGRVEKELPCSAELACESRCSAMRACGRHACRRRCCEGGAACPPCTEVCGRRLGCNNHKCMAPCHSGPCRPCPLTFSVACACGATKHALPCGAESKAAPPRCARPCQVPYVCRHAALRRLHRCHYGPCPPCRLPCGAELACGGGGGSSGGGGAPAHVCSSTTCHDARPPAVAAWQQPRPAKGQQPAAAAGGASSSSAGGSKRAGADAAAAAVQDPPALLAAAAAASMAASAQTLCPPCMAPVVKSCFGAHMSAEQPCCQAEHFACASKCGRALACGNCSCSKPCHVLEPAVLASASAAAGDAAPAAGWDPAAAAAVAAALPAQAQPCEACARPCALPRGGGCSHPCPRSCHRPPCPPCEVPATRPCFCGKATLRFACHELQEIEASPARAAAALSCKRPCHRALPGCAHPCRAECHAGPCDGAACADEETVRCECRRKKEKWACARIRAALRGAGGGGGAYDAGAASLKLLRCDAECAALQRKANKPEQQQQQQQQQQEEATARPEVAAAAAAQSSSSGTAAAKPSVKRMSRAEREAASAARAEAQLAEERRRKLQQNLLLAAAMAIVFGAMAALVAVVARLLAPPTASSFDEL